MRLVMIMVMMSATAIVLQMERAERGMTCSGVTQLICGRV